MTQRPRRARRSQLSVPGSSEKMLRKGAESQADHVFCDLEDAVAPSAKVEARDKIAWALNNLDWGKKTRCVRINDVTTEWCHGDIISIVENAGANLDTIMLTKPYSAADVIFLDRMLGQTEEIHIRQLGQQDVVVQASGIAAEDAEIEVAHGVGSSQHDLPSVEPELALGLGGFVLLETPQTELPVRRVEQFSAAVDQFDLRLVKPRRFQVPKFCLAQRKGEREEIPSAAHAGGFGIGIVFFQVAETSDPAALALVRMVDVDLRGEILAVDRDEQ